MAAAKRASAKKKDDGPEPLVIHINGEPYELVVVVEVDDGEGGKVKRLAPTMQWLDKLSFKEQNAMRRMARQLADDDQLEIGPDVAFQDLVPPLVTVIQQRQDEAFTLEQALELDWEKLTEAPPQNGAGA